MLAKLKQLASTEVVSIIWGDQADVIKADPAIAQDTNGAPMFTAEVVVLISRPKRSSFKSEIWGDVDLLMDAFERRPVYSSLTLRLEDREGFDSMKERLEADRRLTVTAMREKEYYRSQSQTFTAFITILGNLISTVFSMGTIDCGRYDHHVCGGGQSDA